MKLMDKLKQLRDDRGWTKKDVARRAGVAYTTYAEYEGKKRQCKPTIKHAQAIARVFGLSADYLLDETKGYPPPPETHGFAKASAMASQRPSSLINIIGLVSAGETEIAYDDAGLPVGGSIEEPLDKPYDIKDPNAYGLLIEGNSMLPGYPKGTKVVVCPSETVKTGDIVICRLQSTGKVYIKEVKFQGDMVILSSHNTANYAPMAVSSKDILFCHKVVWVRRP
ncbi:MAG TPA: LexA family transcriptional regulator [Candidatus Brocadiales bacterium]|nr:LexA family transcriptional regulator [Candidatus Brocadiales bacterium]